MPSHANEERRRTIEKVVRLARAKAAKADKALVADFVRILYGQVPPGDIRSLAPAELADSALSFLAFARRRRPGEALVRAYTPASEGADRRLVHSVLEIATDDMPFLVDSVTAEVNRHGHTVHLVVHPIADALRAQGGRLVALALRGGLPGRDEGSGRTVWPESLMQIHIDPMAGEAERDRLIAGVRAVLADVRAAVEDWQPIRTTLDTIVGELLRTVPEAMRGEAAEAQAFLRWLESDHFTFLGYREYRYEGRGATARLKVAGVGLGLLRAPERQVFENWREDQPLPPELRAFVQAPELIMIAKSNEKSTVHRPALMDVVGIKTFDHDGHAPTGNTPNGRVVGERIILGLFTSTVYNRSPRDIPVVRRKIEAAIERAGFPPASHDRKALEHIFDTYPRDELLQIDVAALAENALGILHLQERQRVALFLRKDRFKRFVTALVFVPRERYTSELGERFAKILGEATGGRVVASYPQLTIETPLAQVLYVIKTDPAAASKLDAPKLDARRLEAALAQAARSWRDDMRDALVLAHGAERGMALFKEYGDAFGPGYRARYHADNAVFDLERVEDARRGQRIAMHLYRPRRRHRGELRLKLYRVSEPLPLSDVLPVLENMGLRVIEEEPFEITCAGGVSVWLRDFHLQPVGLERIDADEVRARFHAALSGVFQGAIESDGFNRLVLFAGLEWRDVVVLRALARFLLQARIPYSQGYMEATLTRNAEIARRIALLFHARFAPAGASRGDRGEREEGEEAIRADILARLDGVASLDEDRILRRFMNAVTAALRTNFFQPGSGGAAKDYLSIKFDSHKLDGLPLPRPRVEVFVYGVRMEGCHLRGGKVARGGIRWSDRPEDFRTEILGLMKAQMVKNAVIVPVGAKGGFVCKCLPPAGAGRAAVQAEVIACYRMLMRGLLDLTDNLGADSLGEGGVVAPQHVVRHDDDDPYLVVAADKGTATFSDIANQVAAEYGFWLGDAFASGGSAGYDHKTMGITARGAWKSVTRHFREMGRDIQNEDFTVVGVGDMSGDVFGNGLLLSRHTRLMAAFNHLHIFIDPDPDPATTYRERRRLFRRKRGGWDAYDPALISKGGGVFERRAKSIRLSAEIRARFDIAAQALAPQDLIKALLKARVDLLWFGGIGTFVKAEDQTDAEADDRANDALRVNAESLRCAVVGEGANLGLTQLARIAYARKGGRLNADFIDNSAGVDCSDHEVNIKIVLNGAVSAGRLTRPSRDAILKDMTGEVARLVLNDNYLQTQAISLAMARAQVLFDQNWRFMRVLERAGRLDRAVEFLPDDEEMEARSKAGEGLARPEYAVIFAYAKLTLFEDLLATNVPDDPYLVRDLARYFPRALREPYGEEIAAHRLRREIIATYVTNSMVNRVGAAFVNEMQARTGHGPDAVARAYVIARDTLALRPVWRAIEALDHKVAWGVQAEMITALERLVTRATLWFLRRWSDAFAIESEVERFRAPVAALAAQLQEGVDGDLSEAIGRNAERWKAAGVPADLAGFVAAHGALTSACDIALIAERHGWPAIDAARLYFDLGRRLGIGWLRRAAETLPIRTHWERMAVASIIDDSFAYQAVIADHALGRAGEDRDSRHDARRTADAWVEASAAAIGRVEAMVGELRAVREPTLAMLTVATRQMREITAGA